MSALSDLLLGLGCCDKSSADMHAMWTFLDGGGYCVDIDALHRSNPQGDWTSSRYWTQRTLTR
ncbi:hypothetical protein ACQPZ2_34095 [Nocardia pseudovaccinii]|uniref:hypothetical protein n=1 Tax=Nocardia pseudovaccinii TaxID=189540 RepID=UPI003D947599